MLRIILVLSILAGLGAGAVAHLVVKPKIEELTTNLENAETQSAAAVAAQGVAEEESRKARAAEGEATEKLADLSALHTTTTRDLGVQTRRANELETQVTRVTIERNDAQQELAQFRAIGIPADQIRAQRDELIRSREERDALSGELQIVIRNNGIVQAELDRFRGVTTEVPLPPGLRGKVLVADPKHDFVVLNLGRRDGLIKHGKLLVNREGNLVGKVEITRIEEDRSIANVLAEWKQSDVLEGDDVLVR